MNKAETFVRDLSYFVVYKENNCCVAAFRFSGEAKEYWDNLTTVKFNYDVVNIFGTSILPS